MCITKLVALVWRSNAKLIKKLTITSAGRDDGRARDDAPAPKGLGYSESEIENIEF